MHTLHTLEDRTPADVRAITARTLSFLSCYVLLGLFGAAAQASCPPSPTTQANGMIEGSATDTSIKCRNATVAVDNANRFIIAWEVVPVGGKNQIQIQRYDASGNCLCNSGDECPAILSPNMTLTNSAYEHPSLAVEQVSNPDFFLAWDGTSIPITHIQSSYAILTLTYPFVPTSPTVFNPGEQSVSSAVQPEDRYPSVGVSDGGSCAAGFTRENISSSVTSGLAYRAACSAPGSATFIRTCNGFGGSAPYCYPTTWQPCLSMRGDAAYNVGWSNAGSSVPAPTDFDIQLNEYTSAGTQIGSTITVNQVISSDDTIEKSTATAIRDNEMVAVWMGSWPDNCATRFRVYARRLQWSSTTQPALVGDQFIVDSDPDFAPVGLDGGNPTVAIGPGNEFVVAWNVSGPNSGREVHAQFFKFDGDCVRTMGREFRVNQDNSLRASLAESAQHTWAYRTDGGVVFTWTLGFDQTAPKVYFTIVPAGYAQTLEATAPCVKGDCNEDGVINGDDIKPFEDVLLPPTPLPAPSFDCHSLVENCRFDTNSDGNVTIDDVPPFICMLLGLPGNCNGGTACFGAEITDCNDNNIDDKVEIHLRSTADCNSNGRPDECDIALSYSVDTNENGVPDECDPADCNDNGIDDLSDIAEETSADCNLNGWPDECEPDCNENGVPDDCDIDPTDPDGDEVVFDDCNNSSLPDECDLELPLNPSFDCNENGIPDECDIASEDSEDLNENGIPDECDFILGRGAGEGSGEIDEDAAWLAFYEWQIDEQAALLAMSPADRFQATIDKLAELGLPVAIPWAEVRTP